MGELKQVSGQVVGGIVLAALAFSGGILVNMWLSVTVPKGAVIAFDIDLDGSCPRGWRPYTDAEGRFIRGADPSPRIDPDVPHRSDGGSENLDGERRPLPVVQTSAEDVIVMVHGQNPSILPPFLALQFCTPD